MMPDHDKSEPERSILAKVWKVLDEQSGAFTSLGVFVACASIITAGVAIYSESRHSTRQLELHTVELEQQNEMFRASALLEYAERYNSTPFNAERLALTAYLNAVGEGDNMEGFLAYLEEGDTASITRMADFFAELQWCLEQRICSEDKLLSRFARPALYFYSILHVYLKCRWEEEDYAPFEKIATEAASYLKANGMVDKGRGYSFSAHLEACPITK